MEDDEFGDDFEDAPDTEIAQPTIDELDAVAVPSPVAPEVTPRPDSTGRHRLSSAEFASAIDATDRDAYARGLEHGRARERVAARTAERMFLLAALRFFLIDLGSNMAGADDLVARFHAWVMQDANRQLVEVALGWDKVPP